MLIVSFVSLATALKVVDGFRIKSDGMVSARKPTQGSSDCLGLFHHVLRNVAVKDMFDASKDVEFGRVLQKKSYYHQWNSAAKKVPLVSDAESGNHSLTLWEDVLLFDGYRFERERLHKIGRISEKSFHRLAESTVQSICELAPVTLKSLLASHPFVQAIQSQVGDRMCESLSLQEANAAIRSALEVQCVAHCESVVSEYIDECDELDTVAFSALFERWDTQCVQLPYEMIEAVAEHAMRKKCLTFPPPSVLWEPNDKAAGSLAMMDVTPPCVLPHRQRHQSRLHQEITMQSGICPEGTRCKCLNQAMWARPSVADLRGEGARIFVRSGAASAISLTKQYTRGFLVSTFVFHMAIGGASIGAALLSTVHVPMFLAVGTAIMTIKGVVAMARFDCETSLGCWPSSAVHVVGRGCRLKPTAKYGKSPFWFLPPPGTKLHRKAQGCVVDRCEPTEHVEQMLGFSKLNEYQTIDTATWMESAGPDVAPPPVLDARSTLFNCQPLSYEEMTWQQREHALDLLLASGLGEEYQADIDAAVAIVSAGQAA